MIPKKDSDLATWSRNFRDRIVQDPHGLNLTEQLAQEFSDRFESYYAAYMAVSAEGARSKALVFAKESSKRALLILGRELYMRAKSSPQVTAEQRAQLGIHRDKRTMTPVSPPDHAPRMGVLGVDGYRVRVIVADASVEGKRRRPPNAAGAMIMSFAGDAPSPPGQHGWKVHGQLTRNMGTLEFPPHLPPGTKISLTAYWYNRRGQRSPWCEPIHTHLQGMSSSAAATALPAPAPAPAAPSAPAALAA